MKQIINECNDMETISLSQMYISASGCSTSRVIAYKPTGRRNDGLAVLQDSGQGTYGWFYLTDLIKGKYDMKFECESKAKSLKEVLETGRVVILFDSMHEFLQYAGEISEPG